MSSRPAVAGIDAGTSGCKVTVLDQRGQILATAYRSYRTHHASPGWAEQDPADWVRAARAGLVEAIARAGQGGDPVRLLGLSFSAPHHVAVLCDDSGDPVRRAIMWTDQRSAEIAGQTAASHGELIWQQCGNVPAATWTLPQMQWLRVHEPEALSRTRHVLLMKDFVRSSFCAGPVTDAVDATGTMLYDPSRRRWIPELLDLAGLDAAAMPEVVKPTDVVGSISADHARELGVDPDVVILTGSADTALELLAAGCVTPGDHTLKLATAGNVSHVESQRSTTPDTISYPYLLPDTFYLNSATNSAAASFEWLAKTMAGADPVGPELFTSLDDEADKISPGSDGLTFHPYLNGERAPHWNPALRASFVGLTSAHGRGHLARAVMEGVAMSMREARGAQAAPLANATLIGGGARSAVWAQIMADVFRTELWVPQVADSSLGGAMLAATRLAWLDQLSDGPRFLGSAGSRRTPDASSADDYDHTFERYQRIQRALQPGYDADHEQ